MRVGLFTWGSEGDVRPFVALGAALAARGHAVELSYVLINGTDLGPLCAAHGFASRFVAREKMAAMFDAPGPHQAVLEGRGSPLEQVHNILEGLLDPVTREMFDDARASVDRYDVVVVHILHHPASTAALARGKPVVYVLTAPVLPTRAIPPIGAPSLGPLNRAVWWLAERMAGKWFLPRVNALRAEVGLPLIARMYPDPNPEVALGLTCVSPALFPRPSDWPPQHHVPGFFELPVTAGEIPADVRAFLDAGEPPVLLTFGSMLVRAGEHTDVCIRAMFEAAEAAGARAIIQLPEHARAAHSSSSRVLVAGALPHGAVLPRCALVVHHGGAGTTQAATLAARPSVVVPFMADQFFWAARLRAAGVSVATVPRSKLTGARLAAAIARTQAAPEAAARAAKVAGEMRAEEGAATAAALIEGLRAPHGQPMEPSLALV